MPVRHSDMNDTMIKTILNGLRSPCTISWEREGPGRIREKNKQARENDFNIHFID